jgi:hypothetical protein
MRALARSPLSLCRCGHHRINGGGRIAQEKQVALLERMIPRSTLTTCQGQEQQNRWIKAQFTCDVKGNN